MSQNLEIKDYKFAIAGCQIGIQQVWQISGTIREDVNEISQRIDYIEKVLIDLKRFMKSLSLRVESIGGFKMVDNPEVGHLFPREVVRVEEDKFLGRSTPSFLKTTLKYPVATSSSTSPIPEKDFNLGVDEK